MLYLFIYDVDRANKFTGPKRPGWHTQSLPSHFPISQVQGQVRFVCGFTQKKSQVTVDARHKNYFNFNFKIKNSKNDKKL